MKRNLLRAFALLLMAVILTTAFVCNATYAKATGETVTFTVTDADGNAVGEGYTTWDNAAAAAASGSTITMNGEYTAEATVSIPAGATLDLNGCTLTVNGGVNGVLQGARLIDSSDTKAGLLVASGTVQLNPDNGYLPVHNGTGYMFLQPNMTSSYQKFVRQTDGSYYFAFRPGFGYVNGDVSIAKTILANGNNGLEMRFTVLTKEDGYSAAEDGLSDKEYYFNAEKLGVEDVFKYVYGNGKMFFCRLNGAEDLSQLRIKTTIVSDTGVYYSAESTAKAVLLDFSRDTAIDNLKFDTVTVNNTVTFDDATDTMSFVATSNMFEFYDEVLSANTIFVDVKFSDITLTTNTNAAYIALRYRGADDKYKPLFRIRGDGIVDTQAGTITTLTLHENTTYTYGPLEVTLAFDPTTGSLSVWNKTAGTVSNLPLTEEDEKYAPVLNGYLGIYSSGASANVTGLKVYTDANTTFGDLLSDIQVEKDITLTLDDGENADGLRPANVTLQALNGNTVVKEMEVAAASGTYTFTDLPKYDDGGKEITYTYTAKVEHYATTVDGAAITLTHTPNITVLYDNDFSQAWTISGSPYTQILDDPDDKSGMSVVTNGHEIKDGYLSLPDTELAENDQKRMFYFTVSENLSTIQFKVKLPEGETLGGSNKDANQIYLRISSGDRALRFYSDKLYSGDKQKYIDLSDTEWVQVWIQVDTENSTYYYRFNKGSEVVSGEGTFTGTFARFELYGYNGGDTLLIDDMLTYVDSARVDKTGTITWNDIQDMDGIRPPSVTVNLYNGSVLVGTADVTADSADAEGNWVYSFTDLPVTNATENIPEAEKTYNYRVEVVAPDGYTAASGENGSFTLTHMPTERDVAVTWSFDDYNDLDGLRPSTITLQVKNGETLVKSVDVDAAAGAYTFEGLPVCEGENVIEYTVTAAAANYVPSFDETGAAFTLTHTPNITVLYDNDFSQAWTTPGTIYTTILDHPDDTSGMSVMTNGHEIKDGYLSLPDTKLAENDQKRMFYFTVSENLSTIQFKVKLPEGKTLGGSSTDVDHIYLRFYNSSIDRALRFYSDKLYSGDKQKYIDLSDTEWVQVWIQVDTENSTYYYRFNKGSEVVSGKGTFTGTLGRFELYGYNGGDTLLIDDMLTYVDSARVDKTGALTWSDGDDADGIRPDSVTVNLYEGEDLIKSAVVTADETANWNYAFENLPAADSDSNAYNYSVTVTGLPEGYTAVPGENGNISLNYTPTKKNVTVNWTWADSDNHDRIRPETVTVSLYVGEEQKYSQEVSSDALTYTFAGVPIDDYTVKIADIDGYTVEGTDGTFTLSHTAVMSWYYWNDFNTAYTITAGSYDAYADDAGNTITVTGSFDPAYTSDDENGFLRYTNTSANGRIFFSKFAQIMDISFRVRLPEGVDLPEYGMILRVNNKGSYSKLLAFERVTDENEAVTNHLYIGDEDFTITNGVWVEISLKIDTIGNKLTYTVTDGTNSISGEKEAAYNTANRLEMYGYTGLSFDLDDLKIGVDTTAASDLTGTVTDTYGVATKVDLLQNGVKIAESYIVDGAYSFTGLKAVDENGDAYTYTLSTDAPWPTYYATTTDSDGRSDLSTVFVNAQAYTTTVTLEWNGDDMSVLPEDETVTVTIVNDDEETFSASALVGATSVVVPEAPVYAANGAAINYVTATTVVEGSYWTVQNTGNMKSIFTFDSAAYEAAQALFSE